MSDTQKCPTFLIDDRPADEDAFGPHQRVADAIADLIESEEEGGKVIGLEGGWGAGKSTVIGFLEKRFAQNQNYKVITFDAWAHEGDPLRRTYLETLIRNLQQHNWVPNKRWDDEQEELANRRKIIHTKTIPKPTVLGTFLTIALFFVPVGMSLFSSALKDGVTLDTALPTAWKFIFGGTMAAAPLLVLLARVLYLILKRPISLNRVVDLSEWAFLQGDAISETRTESVETPNPTSIEFEDVFARLMKDALTSHPQRRLLLVLDNLDRVDPKSALAIWSTLQTFLQDRNQRNEDWFTRLWVIVPYDPSGLRQLWDNRRGVVTSKTEDVAEAESSDTTDQRASGSFLDKSFQVRFHVPPPVLSDWKTYLYGLVERALPNHVDDSHLIYRVFDHCRTRNGEPPTPRELKLYVNQIGAVHRQWQDDFPIGHVAYFVLHRRTSKSFVEDLRSSTLPSEEAIRLLEDNLKANLAGLIFNVTSEKGMEFLLGDPIYQALAAADHENLKELEEKHGDGFWPVLEIVTTTKFGGTDASTISKAGVCLYQSDLLKENERQEAKTVLEDIRHAAESVTKWSPFDNSMAESVSSLCQLQNDLEFSKKVLKGVASAFSGKAEAKDVVAKPEEAIDSLSTVLKTVESLGHSKAIPKSFVLPVDAEGWITACNRLNTTDAAGKFWNRIRPKCEFGDISTIIQTAAGSGQISEQHIVVLRVTNASPIKSSWAEVVSTMRQRLDASLTIPATESHLLLTALCELRVLGSGEATAALNELAVGGHILHQMHSATSENHDDCRAMCLFTFLRERPGMAKPAAVGNSDTGHSSLTSALSTEDVKLATRFTTTLKRFKELSLIFSVVDKSQYHPLLSVCLRQIADSHSPELLFTSDVILQRWMELKNVLNDTEIDDRFRSLVGRLAMDHALCHVIENKDGGFSPDEAELYLAINVSVKEELPDFAEWCKNGLDYLPKDEWTSDLTGGFNCCRLALDLANQDRSPELKTVFSDALATHAKSVLVGKHVPPDDMCPVWRRLLDCLAEEATRKELRTRLIETAASQDGKLHKAFFEMYGDEIDDPDCLAANERILSHFFSLVLRDRNIPALRWLDSFFDGHPKFLKKVSDETTVQAFENRLQEYVDDPTDDEAQPLIEQIADKLGIEAATVDSETSDEIETAEEGSNDTDSEEQ